MILREKKIKRIFFTTLLMIAIFVSNSQTLNNSYKLQDDKINNTFNEHLLDVPLLSSNLNMDDNIEGSGLNQDVRIFVNNQSELLNNEEFFEIPSNSSDDIFLSYGDFNFTFQNNYTTEYILEEDTGLDATDFISFDFNEIQPYSDITYGPGTLDISGNFNDLVDSSNTTNLWLTSNTTTGILNFTVKANYTDETYTNPVINGNVEFNRTKILALILSLLFELNLDANLTIKIRDYSQSTWINLTDPIPINSSIGIQEIKKKIINENLNYIDLSDVCYLQFFFERKDLTSFEGYFYNLELESTYAFDLPITNNTYVALEFDLKGEETTVNGFYAWIRTLDLPGVATTQLNMTLYRADDTFIRTEGNLRNIQLNPNYNEIIDSKLLLNYNTDNISYFEFNTANTQNMNLSNYFIVIKSNNSDEVYSLVTLPYYDFTADGETDHQLITTNNNGGSWSLAKKQVDTTMIPYTSGQLDASPFRLNVTRGYMPSDFIYNDNNTLRIQNMTIENLEISAYPYNESSYLTWGLGRWNNNFTTVIENTSANEFEIYLEWNKSIIEGFKFNISYSINAYWIENALATYSSNYDEDPKWTLGYNLNKTLQKFDNWDYLEFWYIYPNYFNAQYLTNPINQQILNQTRGQSVLIEDPSRNKIIVTKNLSNLDGIYSLNLTSFNFINNMHSFNNINNNLVETNGFMYGDNISVSLGIQDLNLKAPISGYANVSLFYPNGSKYLNAELTSSAGTIEDSTLFYDFNNQTIINLTSAVTVFGEYHLGYFWFNGSAIGCKKLNIFIVPDLNTTILWELEPFVIDEFGAGDYTWTDAILYPWCTGLGSWNDPYVIENVIINGQNSSSCIEIRNSNVFFIIKNCTFYNSSGINWENGGIALSNVNNGSISNNNCSFNQGSGIILTNSNNNTIKSNKIFQNNQNGINFSISNNSLIYNNSINQNYYHGINLYTSAENNISANIVNNNLIYGIHLDNSNLTTVLGNIFSNNVDCYHEIDSYNNEFSWNVIDGLAGPIIIDEFGGGNFTWSEASSQLAWCTGSGIWSDPYVIENLEINAGAVVGKSCIRIKNSVVPFIIRNCNLYNAGEWQAGYDPAGVELFYSDNGQILNNTCVFNEEDGIALFGSNNNIIIGNNVSNNVNQGIWLIYSDNNKIERNAANNGTARGFCLQFSDNNILRENLAKNNVYDGIRLNLQNNNNSIIANIANNNSRFGISLGESTNTKVIGNILNKNGNNCYDKGIGENNTFKWNICNGVTDPIIIDEWGEGNFTWSETEENLGWCTGSGSWSDPYVIENVTINGFNTSSCIDIKNSNEYFTIRNCVLYNSSMGPYPYKAAIELWNVTNSFLFNNSVSNNIGRGIFLVGSNNNTISKNKIINNLYKGVSLWNSANNSLYLNNISGNFDGLDMSTSHNNTISINTVIDNDSEGIELHYSHNNDFYNNTISNNIRYGLYLYESNNNTLNNNFISSNSREGIYLISSNNSIIFHNFFTNNDPNARDNGYYNQWDNGTIGNFWHDYTGADLNDDGIGDIPYIIPGSPGAQDNFPIWDDGIAISWNLNPFVIDDSGGGNYTWDEVILQPWCNGSGILNDPYIIENITINGQNSGNCLEIRNSNAYFIVRNCILFNSGENWMVGGIKLHNVSNGILLNINCSNNNWNGIFIYSSNNNQVINCTLNNNKIGIVLHTSCSNNSILKSGINNNSEKGIFVYSSFNNHITNNSINDNIEYGIDLAWCFNNTILENSLNNNYEGIRIQDCNKTKILNNTISNNLISILLSHSNDTTVLNNKLGLNSNDALIAYNCTNSVISQNYINDHFSYGILLDADTENFLIYFNTFLNNSINAIDNGINNDWDNGTIGNYWDDYSGRDTNDDGIGDSPYIISGTSGSQDNFPIWNDGIEEFLIFNPFIIDDTGGGNFTWAQAMSYIWCYGFGTSENPYIIEKLIIDGTNSNSCLIIRNSNAYFIIRNCKFYNSGNGIYDAGIKLEYCTNGKLINVNCSGNNGNGILLDHCQNFIIEENSVNENNINGIFLLNSDRNFILNNKNTINSNYNNGINLILSNNNTISGNTINYNSVGISLSESNYNNITSNDLRYNNKAYEEIDSEGNLHNNNLGLDYNPPNNIIFIIVIVSIITIALFGGISTLYILKKRNSDKEQKELIKIEKRKQKIKDTLQKRILKIENFIQENDIERAISKLKEYEVIAVKNDLNEIVEEIIAKINHCNNLNLNRANQVKRVILELSTKFTRLQIIDIAERSGIQDEEFLIKIIKEMIENREIYAEFFSTSKAVAFDQQKNRDEIDMLMETYKELEETDIEKKIEITQESAIEVTTKEEEVISSDSKLEEIHEINAFLSYSTLDTEHFEIKKTAEILEQFPEITTVLFWEANSSANIVEYMEETLRKTNVFILFCSENSMNSKAVRDEWQAAFQLRKKDLMKIIPVYEKEEYIPYLLTPLLNVKFQKDNFKVYIQKLYDEILRP